MNFKSLVLLLILVGAVVAAYWGLQQDRDVQVMHSRVGELLLPNLAEQLNDIKEVQIIAPGNKKTVSLTRVEDGWIVTERNGFPANIGELKKQLLALAQAKIIETKTSNPELYSRLQVQPISNSEGDNRELRLKFANRDEAVIIGKPGPQMNSSRYVRRSNEETSWLIDRNIVIDQDVPHWIQKNVFDIKANRIARIEIKTADESIVELVNKDPATANFKPGKVKNEGDEFAEALVSMVTNAFDAFQLLDVLPENQLDDDWTQSSEGRVETFDGVVIQFQMMEHGDEHFVRIKSHFDEDLVNEEALVQLEKQGNSYSVENAKKQVADIRDIAEGWIYKIPNVTFEALTQPYNDMLVIVDE